MLLKVIAVMRQTYRCVGGGNAVRVGAEGVGTVWLGLIRTEGWLMSCPS